MPLENKEINNELSLLENIIKLSRLGILDLVKKVGENSYAARDSLANAYSDMADFLLKIGQPDLAETYYRLSLDAAFIPATYSGYLQCLLLNPTCTMEKMYREASAYSFFFKDVSRYNSYDNELTQNRKLNIGYICHFFHNTVSRSQLLPFIAAHNRRRTNIFCYSDTNIGEVSEDIKAIADVWHDTKDFNDEVLCELIRKDKIDILLELNGHCAINRYGVIARKPAPVQVSFYNISTTSGVPGFDYIMVGDGINIDNLQSYYTESFYFIKGATGIAIFPEYFPCPSPAPCLENGYITFGSFGAAHKVNGAVIDLWCKVLKEIPSAKLYMKAGVLSESRYLEAYQKQFEFLGIGEDRVYLEGFSEHQKMLECYSKMDIALDTIPHGGGTTTLEALWQGVPVLTLSGNTYCMQHGKVILERIGHPELVSYSEDEFINKAVILASSQERLINYRNNLRDNFRKSSYGDINGFVTNLENAYFGMWIKYCDNTSVPINF